MSAGTGDDDSVEALVLRTLRYGEADLISHVLTRHEGRRGVIAKGARRTKSRLGARLEPFLAVRLQLHRGRGDLAIVRGVELAGAHEALRASWRAQQLGAAALDLATRLTVEHEPNEPAYHLLRNFLDMLDSTAGRSGEEAGGRGSDERRGASLLAAFELKLLHVVGIAPQLGACVRCGRQDDLVAYSAADGGVACSGCRVAGDLLLDAEVHAAAVALMRMPLAEIAARPAEELPRMRALRTVGAGIVAATCMEHAGVRPKSAG